MVEFYDYSTAGSASITNVDNTSATLCFANNSNAGQGISITGSGIRIVS